MKKDSGINKRTESISQSAANLFEQVRQKSYRSEEPSNIGCRRSSIVRTSAMCYENEKDIKTRLCLLDCGRIPIFAAFPVPRPFTQGRGCIFIGKAFT